MDKIKKILNKNKKKAVLVAVVLCVLVIIAVVSVLNGGNGSGDRKRAKQLYDSAEKEIDDIKKDVPKMDRDTFITVDDKVVVGFVEIPSLSIRYPVINVFDRNTCTYSLCRNGDGMPWDIEGMTIYGIDSFTGNLGKMKYGDKLIFEDLTGKKYDYRYEKRTGDDEKKLTDYGINICEVDKNGKEIKKFCFINE